MYVALVGRPMSIQLLTSGVTEGQGGGGGVGGGRQRGRQQQAAG